MVKEAKEMAAVRLAPSVRRQVKAIASRLRVNESDVLRFAIEAAVSQLETLCDPVLEGTDLVSALAEQGVELGRALDLDVSKLDEVLNGDLEDESKRVPRDVIAMILGGSQCKDYVEWLMRFSSGEEKPSFDLLTPRAYLQGRFRDPRSFRSFEEQMEHEERQSRLSR
jgi:hypothetical protein